jgi:uncharacterized protein YoxC
MNGQIWAFVIAIALIMLGIIFSRTDSRELRTELRTEMLQLRTEISQLRTETSQLRTMHSNFTEFYRSLGQHDIKIENLEKRRS